MEPCNYNTREKRLKIYKSMLRAYIIGWIFLSNRHKFRRGFCNYLSYCYYNIYIQDLPELYSLRPKISWSGTNFWFKVGKKWPRIKLLIKAIHKTKQLIK
jgi:hypothetical protein